MKFAFLARALVCAFPCLATAQIATLHIQITDGEGTVYTAGARSARPIAVEVTDDLGKPVAGAAVSFRLPDDGPGGVFGNGLRTDLAITDANGRATVRNLQANRTPGAFQVRITASKEQARAGTLARQFIGGSTASGTGAAPAAKAKSGKKWVVVALVAAGIAGGVGAGVAGRSTPPKPAAPPPTVSLGDPVIVVGKP